MGGAHVRGEAVPRGEEQRRDREDRGGGAPAPPPRLPALPLQPDVFLLVVRAVSSAQLLRRQVVPQVGDAARGGWARSPLQDGGGVFRFISYHFYEEKYPGKIV